MTEYRSLSRFCEAYHYSFDTVRNALKEEGFYTDDWMPTEKARADSRLQIKMTPPHLDRAARPCILFPEDYLLDFVTQHGFPKYTDNVVPLRETVSDPYVPVTCSCDFKGKHLAVIELRFSNYKSFAEPYEIGVVNEKGEPLLHLVMDTRCGIADYITRKTGITNKVLRGSPYFADCADQFERVLQGRVLVMRSVNRNMKLLNHALRTAGRPEINDRVICVNDLMKKACSMTDDPDVLTIPEVSGSGTLQDADRTLLKLAKYLDIRDKKRREAEENDQ